MMVAFHNPTYPTWYDRLIRLKTNSTYVHTELLFDEMGVKRPGFYTSFSSVIDAGSRFQDDMNFLTSEWKLVALPDKWDWQPIYNFCSGMAHKRYDLLGILGFILPWGEHDDSDIFCSESTTDAIQYRHDGELFPHQKAWMVSPGDLYKLVTNASH